MQFRLRTLLILLAVLPPLVAAHWFTGWEGPLAAIFTAGVVLAAMTVLSLIGSLRNSANAGATGRPSFTPWNVAKAAFGATVVAVPVGLTTGQWPLSALCGIGSLLIVVAVAWIIRQR
jgi:hypothetical protein